MLIYEIQAKGWILMQLTEKSSKDDSKTMTAANKKDTDSIQTLYAIRYTVQEQIFHGRGLEFFSYIHAGNCTWNLRVICPLRHEDAPKLVMITAIL